MHKTLHDLRKRGHRIARWRGTITGTIFKDVNGDTVRQTGDNPATNYGVYLDLNNDAKYSSNEPLVHTSSTGRFTFAHLAPGTYTARLMDLAEWRASIGPSASVK